MDLINKQRFLTELSKLLTFMYDEDRERAVEMYGRMFDEAGDELALIQALVSPTMQAVTVARAYNSELGSLAVRPGAKTAPEDRDENGVPDYVQAIDRVREKAFAMPGVAPQPVEKAEEEEEPEEENKDQLTLFPSEEPSEEEAPEADDAGSAEAGEETADEDADALFEEAPVTPSEEVSEEPSAAVEPEEAAEESAEADAPAAPAAAEESETPAGPVPAEAEDGIERFTLPAEGTSGLTPEEERTGIAAAPLYNVDTGVTRVRRQPRVFLLIVYILFAIPITLAAIVLLLIPALLFLALSVALIICGIAAVSAAFNGLVIFADIMVVLGLALILFALSLLFLWASIWFVGGAIVGLVHGIAALCDKWCYKEVPEQ